MIRFNLCICLIITGLFANFFPVELCAETIFQSVGIASTPNPVGSGARAMGMGGSFIGIADDATAASWNPAGLIQLETPELSVVGAYVTRKEDFSSSLQPEINSKLSIDESSLNYFSFAYPFAFLNKNMEFAINYQRLYDFRRNLDYCLELSSSPSTPLLSITITSSEHRTYSQDGFIGALGLAYAVEITPRVSLGLTLNIWTDRLGFHNGWEAFYANHSTTTFGSLTVIEDTYITEKYSGFEGINFNLGALWDINEHLTIGAVLKTPFKGDLHYENKEDWTAMNEDGDIIEEFHGSYSEKNKLKMPMSYGIGAAWRFSDTFTMDLDIYRTDWSNYILINSEGKEFSPIDASPKSESNVKDTTQVHLGSEYLIINPDKAWVIPIRGGIFYDPEPYLDKIRDFHGFSLGSGFGHKRCIFDAAYQLRWGHNLYTGWDRPETRVTTIKSTNDILQHSFLLSFIYYL